MSAVKEKNVPLKNRMRGWGEGMEAIDWAVREGFFQEVI